VKLPDRSFGLPKPIAQPVIGNDEVHCRQDGGNEGQSERNLFHPFRTLRKWLSR
jgi:hypothetical protein